MGDVVNLSLNELRKDVAEPKCKGLFFRCIVNQYYSATRAEYVAQTKFRKLKKQSCDGCESCDGLEFDLSEIANGGFGEDAKPIIHNHIDGAVYRLTPTNFSQDWETGVIDGYDLEFVRENIQD